MRFFQQTATETLIHLEQGQGWINALLLQPMLEEEQLDDIETPRAPVTTYYARGNLFWYAAATVSIFVLTELF